VRSIRKSGVTKKKGGHPYTKKLENQEKEALFFQKGVEGVPPGRFDGPTRATEKHDQRAKIAKYEVSGKNWGGYSDPKAGYQTTLGVRDQRKTSRKVGVGDRPGTKKNSENIKGRIADGARGSQGQSKGLKALRGGKRRRFLSEPITKQKKKSFGGGRNATLEGSTKKGTQFSVGGERKNRKKSSKRGRNPESGRLGVLTHLRGSRESCPWGKESFYRGGGGA